MRVLLDNCTPRGVASLLPGHAVEECRSRGWDKVSNGDLLDAAEAAGFEVFITTDQNIANNKTSLAAGSQPLPWAVIAGVLIRAHTPEIVAAVEQTEPGGLTEIRIAER